MSTSEVQKMSESFPPAGYIPSPSALEGIEVFKPAPPEQKPKEEVIDFTCPQCGATTGFSASGGGLTCSHCGYFEAPEKEVVGRSAVEFEFTVETMERAAQGWGEARKEMACENCGARTSLPVENLAYTCIFCGSNKVIQHQATQDLLRPRFLIPFGIDTARCQEISRQWLVSSWMTPAGLRNISKSPEFTEIYLPYWTFDSVTHSDWKAEVGHTKTERYYKDGEWKERTVIEWRWESGHIDLRIDDLVIAGTSKVSSKLLSEISHYNLEELNPYEPKYLAGLQAQAYDIPLEQAWEIGRAQMRERTRLECVAQASTSRIRNFSMSLDFAEESWRYILLPVYMHNFSYEGRSFLVLLNGQNGTIAGQRPVDWTKVWLVIAAILSPGLILGLIGLITIPFAGIGVAIGGLGFILLVIGVVIAFILWKKADSLDDA